MRALGYTEHTPSQAAYYMGSPLVRHWSWLQFINLERAWLEWVRFVSAAARRLRKHAGQKETCGYCRSREQRKCSKVKRRRMNLRKRCMCHGWESVSCLLYRVGVRPLVRAIYLASRARWTAVSGDGQEDQKVTAPPSVRV